MPLPDLVAHFVGRSTPPRPALQQVRIAQRGEMRRAPGARVLPFTAVQSIAIERVGFSWRGRFPIAGPLAMSVVDEFSDDHGSLVVRILGFPVMRQEGPETATGEALRYLSELPLAPVAMERNTSLEWRRVDDRAAEVATVVRGERLAVRFDFDAEGDIVRASTAARAIRRDKAWTTAPWGGEFRDYATFDGMRIPTRAEVHWDLPAGRFVYWTGTITSVTCLDRPFEGSHPHGSSPG